MSTLNLMDTVSVRLTPRALGIHRENYEKLCHVLVGLPPYKAPLVDQQGWTNFKLWGMRVMSTEVDWSKL